MAESSFNWSKSDNGMPSPTNDVEKGSYGDYAHLNNDTVQSYTWDQVTVTVKDRETKQPKKILDNVSGYVQAGEIIALMGPSGSGKTTMLNVLSGRDATSNAHVEKSLRVNGKTISYQNFRKISSFVEQEDALLGALTVEETLYFSARLALPRNIPKAERIARIEGLISSFGLRRQARDLIGTPIRKGISGGQKRRVSVASQLITSPKILFLDEPTSGLDSAASHEVMSFIRDVAKNNRLLVIASIHQPSTSTFELFDKLLLLSQGRTVYNGLVSGVTQYFADLGYPTPMYTNPAEFIIDMVNTDFSQNHDEAQRRLAHLQDSWTKSEHQQAIDQKISEISSQQSSREAVQAQTEANPLMVPFTLVHRSLIKAYRDVIAYGIRIAMYVCLAILMGTVWLRLAPSQENIQSFTNAILKLMLIGQFGAAFLSFMSVAYIPSFLEDRSLFIKERANGLYGPISFMISNFITGAPFLFIITILFSVISYWLSNFNPTGGSFWSWVLFLFLDLLAAESLVVLVASAAPVFVVALAVTAFANGLWMSVGGFMVPPKNLNDFWRYWAHYSDYQSWVFQGMMVGEFKDRTYSCGSGCRCMYPSPLEQQCKIAGSAVLEQYGYGTDRRGMWVGILIGIIAGYRLIGLAILYMKKK